MLLYRIFGMMAKQTIRFPFSKEVQAKQSEIQGNGFYQQQIFTACLAEYAYYIESKGEAVIIDPLRDIKPYLDIAKERNAKIKYILLSHFHADFVAGHLSLQKATGAQILMGPNAVAPYVHKILNDHEKFNLGEVAIQCLHTPGHTQESSCYLLLDKEGNKHSLYTGDTLFLGEVGRPDLAVKSDLTQYDLAGMLFESLRRQIFPLPDQVIVYPGHGAGSSCGKNISSGFSCTVGEQKKKNYALQPMTKEQFINVVANDMPKPPNYFFYNAALNKRGNLDDITAILDRVLKPLGVEEVKRIMENKDSLILDSRNSISGGFIKGSINIGLNTTFASWVGSLVSEHKKLVLLCEEGMEEQTVLRLSRIGYDNIAGYLEGGIEGWERSGGSLVKPNEYDPKEFLSLKNGVVLDVRTQSEWDKGVLKGAQLIDIVTLEQNVGKLNRDIPLNIYCGSGARAKMAATILSQHGFERVNISKKGYADLVSSI